MLIKIYYIGRSSGLKPSLIDFLYNNQCHIFEYDSNAKTIVSQVCNSTPDLILLEDSDCSELIKQIQVKIEVPFMIYSKDVNQFNIDRLLDCDVYGVFSENTSPEEFLINIKFSLKRFEADRKNREDNFFLNEAEKLSNIGHWRLDIKSNKLEWSEESYRIFERERISGDLSYVDFEEAVHPDDRELVRTSYFNSVNKKEPYEIEHRLIVNGKVKFVIEKCETFYNNNEPILSVGTVQDITLRKELEFELKKSKENFNQVILNSPDRGILIDSNHLFILKKKYISAKKLGYLENDIKDKDFYEIVNSEQYYSQLLKSVKRLNLGETFEVNGALIKKWIEEEFTSKQIQLEKLNVNLNRQIELKNKELNTEILEKKRAQELHQVFFNVMEQSSDLVMICGLNGLIEYVNPALCSLSQYDKKELIGKNADIFKSDLYTGSYYKKIWSSILTGRTFTDDFIGKKKNGEVYSVTQVVFPIKNLNGEITQFASLSRDITEKKQLEKKTIDIQEEERSRIARELHDSIGQSITAIRLSIHSIAEKQQIPQQDLVSTLEMIDSLTSSIREASCKLMPSVLKDYGLILATRKLIYQIERSTDIKIYFSHQDDRIRFSEDVELSLYRILQESLNNSLRNSEASEIWISISSTSRKIFLSVKDNGKGFEYNDSVKIVGQGIKNMKHRANLMNGVFQLNSNEKGTEVTVKIPNNGSSKT